MPSHKPRAGNGETAPEITAKERKFIAHYVVHFNGAEAVRFAGFETQQPNKYAYELLAKKHIQGEVNLKLEELGELHYRLADEATHKLRTMLAADRTAIFSADGGLKPPEQWPDECKSMLAGIEIEEVFDPKTGEVIGYTKKVKLSDPKAIADSLLKISGKFIDKMQQVDKNGRPVDPQSTAAPVFHITVGSLPKEKGKK